MNRLTCLLLLLLPGSTALAADDGIDFKVTLGRYTSSDGNDAIDINLRGSQGPNTAWVGLYRDHSGFQQARTGVDHHLDGELLRTVFSLQWASGGAAVGSVTSEIGGSSYAIVGWGRTNVRNYVNLNYDPNDAITLGLGTRALENTELSLFQVRDDRLHTGQQVTHAVWRQHFAGEQRLTIDLYAKRGLIGDGVFVSDRSVSIGYDRGPLFVRIAHDPHAGFTSADQNRLSFGTRF
jgi:hypothetical protein